MNFHFENELAGKIALVTGGSKGAGKAIADRLLAAGAKVIITARNRPEIPGSDIHFIGADLTTRSVGPPGHTKWQNWLAFWSHPEPPTSPEPNMSLTAVQYLQFRCDFYPIRI